MATLPFYSVAIDNIEYSTFAKVGEDDKVEICYTFCMAKKQASFEDALWGACDKLRGTVEPAE